MKKLLFLSVSRCLALCLLLVSASVFAADNDGDGVDNAVDAFPNDSCASLDTDGDGRPDSVVAAATCDYFYDDFEAATFHASWTSVYQFALTAGGQSSTRSAVSTAGASSNAWLVTQPSLPASGTVSFYYKGGKSNWGGPEYSMKDINQAGTTVRLSYVFGWTYASFNFQSLSKVQILFGCPSIGCSAAGITQVQIDKFRISFSRVLESDWDDDNDGIPDTVDAAPLDVGNTTEITLPLDGSYKGRVINNQSVKQ